MLRYAPVRMAALFCALAGLSVPAAALDEDLQCVPYARQVSGIQIYGDAHTWWGQAEDRFVRGNMPEVGAVLAFRPHGQMRLGHVAAVTAIVDARTILVSHANWSTINGTRGHIEDDVMVVDVSRDNDWSKVRVWYTPIGKLGTTVYPVHGFIYSGSPRTHRPFPQYAMARPAPKPTGRVLMASATRQALKSEVAAEARTAKPDEDPIGALLVRLGR